MKTAMKRCAVKLRAEMDGDTLIGHAAVFNQIASVPGGYERFASDAFDEVLASRDTDVVALFNHDKNLVLGRQSAGTLRLKPDDEGLAFEIDLPDTSYANDLRILVKRRDIPGGSVGYLPKDEDYGTAPDGRQLVTVRSLEYLRDIGPVTMPAYIGTDVQLRDIDFTETSLKSQLIRVRHSTRAALWRKSK